MIWKEGEMRGGVLFLLVDNLGNSFSYSGLGCVWFFYGIGRELGFGGVRDGI